MVSLEKYTIVKNYRVCLKSGNRDEHRTIFTGPRKQEITLMITFLLCNKCINYKLLFLGIT